jgi:hypothetical protein
LRNTRMGELSSHSGSCWSGLWINRTCGQAEGVAGWDDPRLPLIDAGGFPDDFDQAPDAFRDGGDWQDPVDHESDRNDEQYLREAVAHIAAKTAPALMIGTAHGWVTRGSVSGVSCSGTLDHADRSCNLKQQAERGGFEPPARVLPEQLLSRQPCSATPAPLRGR